MEYRSLAYAFALNHPPINLIANVAFTSHWRIIRGILLSPGVLASGEESVLLKNRVLVPIIEYKRIE
jgi:hypothetical protein